MSRFGARFFPYLAAAWLVATGAFLFVKGLDISLVACDERTCGDVADLMPGIASFIVGVGMLLAWPFVAAAPDEESWPRRLGMGMFFGALVAVLGTVPVLAVTERLGVPFWICTALISAIAIKPPVEARDLAIRGRIVVLVLLFAAIVAAEVFLEGDAYLLAFTMCVALTPPALAGVDDFSVGWQVREAESIALLGAAGEEDDAQDEEHDEQYPNDVHDDLLGH